jgi:hypothetical protein
MTGMRSQRRAAPPWTETEHSKPQSYPVLQTKLHTVLQPEPHPTEPILLLKYPPSISITAPYPRMNTYDDMESGELSYRTTIPAPEIFSFKSPDELDYDQDNDDSDDDDDSVTCCMVWIEPCKDYANYSSWLQKNFSHLVNKREVHFIDSILQIKDAETLFKFYFYFHEPKQWIDFLGKTNFVTYHKFIIELMLIWTATNNIKDPIDYADYVDTRWNNHAEVADAFKKEANLLLNSDLMTLPVKTPVVYPVYIKISPVVKESSVTKAPEASSEQKKQELVTGKGYKTTSANHPVDNSSSLSSPEHAYRKHGNKDSVTSKSKSFYQIHGVKWDSSLINWDNKMSTATHDGDVKLKEVTTFYSGEVESDVITANHLDSGETISDLIELPVPELPVPKPPDPEPPDPKPPDPKHKESLTVLKHTYTNPGMNIRSDIPLDDHSIDIFVRSRKKPNARRSAKLEKSKPTRSTMLKVIFTKGEPSRITKAMSFTLKKHQTCNYHKATFERLCSKYIFKNALTTKSDKIDAHGETLKPP